jgi:hypothetical protein
MARKTAKKKTAKKSAKKTTKKKAVKKAAAKRAPARKAAKKTAKPGSAKRVSKAPSKARAKKSVKAAKASRGKDVKGEGNYAASRRFRQKEEGFIQRMGKKLTGLGKDARKALEGPEGAELQEAEASTRARGQGMDVPGDA